MNTSIFCTGFVVVATVLAGCGEMQTATIPPGSPIAPGVTNGPQEVAATGAPSSASVAVAVPAAPGAGEMFVGPSSGKSFDPAIAAWQTNVLRAIGRENQYYLFSYVSVGGSVYLGLDYARLQLNEVEIARANVAFLSSDAMREITTRDNQWLMPVLGKPGDVGSRSAALTVTQ